MLLNEISSVPTPALKRAFLSFQQAAAEEGFELKDIHHIPESASRYELYEMNLVKHNVRILIVMEPGRFAYHINGSRTEISEADAVKLLVKSYS